MILLLNNIIKLININKLKLLNKLKYYININKIDIIKFCNILKHFAIELKALKLWFIFLNGTFKAFEKQQQSK